MSRRIASKMFLCTTLTLASRVRNSFVCCLSCFENYKFSLLNYESSLCNFGCCLKVGLPGQEKNTGLCSFISVSIPRSLNVFMALPKIFCAAHDYSNGKEGSMRQKLGENDTLRTKKEKTRWSII